MARYFFLLLLIFCAFVVAKDDLKPELNAIKTLYSVELKPINLPSCTLNKSSLNAIKLDTTSPVFPYFNALLELNANNKLSKVSQDLLMQEVRNKDRLAMLLALELYLLKKCERCEKVRDISNFDYYRFSNSNTQKLLFAEGGDFNNSFVLHGEAFLCKGLDSNKAQYFLKSYANFMLAGLNTRAINTLLLGIERTNDNVLYATFRFLIAHNIVLPQSVEGAYLLDIMRLDSKDYFRNISLLRNFSNLSVIEGGVASSYIILGLMIRDMDMGRVISPFDVLANNSTIREYYDKQKYYEKEIEAVNLKILQNANENEINEYKKILTLKQKLKSQSIYQYVKRH